MTLLFRLADQSPMNCSQYSELHRVDAGSLLYVDPFQDCDEVNLADDYVLIVLSTLPGIVRDHRCRCSPVGRDYTDAFVLRTLKNANTSRKHPV